MSNIAPRHYNPRAIEDLEREIAELIKKGEALSVRLFDTHRRRARLITCNPPAWLLRRQLADVEEQLELAISEYERRQM